MALILKLDESVTDPSLPKLGELFFDVDCSHNFTFTFSANGGAEYTARIIGTGNFFTDGSYSTSAGTTVTQSTTALYLSSGTYRVGITQKYIVRDFGLDLGLADTGALDFDCSNLDYCEYGVTLHYSHWNLKNISAKNVEKATLINCSGTTGIDADVAIFKNATLLTSVNIGTTGFYGDAVDAFGDKINLSLLSCSNTQCTGTYQQICDAMFANGRTSGTMTILVNDGTGVHTVTFTNAGWST